MIEPTKPVSPIFPTETAVESGRVVPGLAGGDAGVEVEGAEAAARPEDDDEETLLTSGVSTHASFSSGVSTHVLISRDVSSSSVSVQKKISPKQQAQ